jgi:hypothetical protein
VSVIEIKLHVSLYPATPYDVAILSEPPSEITLPDPVPCKTPDEVIAAVAQGLAGLCQPGDVIEWEGVRYQSVNEAVRAVYDLRGVWGEFRSFESALVPPAGPTKS